MTTTMETTEFVYATFIRTTPEKLWEALTNGDFSEKYWFGYRVEFELKAGGTVRIHPPKGQEHPGDKTGKVLVCEPFRKLVYTWFPMCGHELAHKREEPSRVTYEITPMGAQTKLRLIHENLLLEDLEKDPNKFQGINNGWPAVISSLKSLLETGEAIVFPTQH
jgi:uncharacterized protein YndB with AHSA1/START domain